MCSIVCIAFSFCSSFTFNIGTSTLASSEKEIRLYIDDEMNQVKVVIFSIGNTKKVYVRSMNILMLLTRSDHYDEVHGEVTEE